MSSGEKEGVILCAGVEYLMSRRNEEDIVVVDDINGVANPLPGLGTLSISYGSRRYEDMIDIARS